MRRFLIKIVVFVLFTALIFFGFYSLISFSPKLRKELKIKVATGGNGASLLRYREAKTYGSVDVLFCGSSHCYRGFDTRIFDQAGIRTFNLGSSSQTPINTLYLLPDYLNDLSPKKLILEVSWITLLFPPNESTIDLISNTPLTSNSLKMVIHNTNRDVFLTYFFVLTDRIYHPLAGFKQRESKYNTYIRGGYVASKLIKNKALNKTLKEETNSYPKNQLEAIEEIIALCKERNIEVIFVKAPVNKTVVQAIKNYEEMDQPLWAIAKQNNIQFIDFNDPMIYKKLKMDPERDWYDNTHLTQSGVEKFNTFFIREYSEVFVGFEASSF